MGKYGRKETRISSLFLRFNIDHKSKNKSCYTRKYILLTNRQNNATHMKATTESSSELLDRRQKQTVVLGTLSDDLE